ncbi:MAG: aminotransferase class V-fold PLP-dependent enzyme [Planctomycetota bacterium]
MSAGSRLYLDNAATSFPKPPAVLDAMVRYQRELGASPGRGSYRESVEGGAILTRCREVLAELINAEPSESAEEAGTAANRIAFTLNTTDALNQAIYGLVRQRRRAGRTRTHLITTAMDHNSVLRPFNALTEDGDVEWTCVPVDPVSGLVDPDEIASAIERDTALVAIVHGSNVSGTVQPIGEIGAVCREHAVPLLVDAAQTIGHMPIDVREMGIDLLAFPGHKGLLGPLGTGGLYLRPGMERVVATSREGGTGSVSELDRHPDAMPDRYECGSHNTIGLAGLAEGARWLQLRGVAELWTHERELMRVALEGLSDEASMPGLRLLGPQGLAHRLGVFSMTHAEIPAERFASELEERFGVLVRAGIHCAPRAHESFGTHPECAPEGQGGAFRMSFGPFVTPQDVSYACHAISEVCRTAAAAPVR